MSTMATIGASVYSNPVMSGSVFAGSATKFSAITSYIALAGADAFPNSKTYTWATWFRFDNLVDANDRFIATQQGKCYLRRKNNTGGNVLEFVGVDSSLNVVSTITGTTAISDTGWHHIFISGDQAAGKSHLYLDGVNDEAGGSIITDFEIEFLRGAGLFELMWGGANLPISFAQGWFSTEYVDAEIAGNMDRFILEGKPVNLGSDGSDASPTSRQPEICLQNYHPNFENNTGSNGDAKYIGSNISATDGPGA